METFLIRALKLAAVVGEAKAKIIQTYFSEK